MILYVGSTNPVAIFPRLWGLYPGPRLTHGPGTKCLDIGQKENTKNLPTNPETVQASRHLSLMQKTSGV